ncbi:MAG TPA: sulfate ABC transporter permease subunit [Chloroflexota bacterium]|nr:sulfate ABC transporter permease subunit [Chloroflexota bacterium]
MKTSMALRLVALGYLALLIALPVALIVWRTFAQGLAPVWSTITQPDAVHAFWLTVLIVVITVPVNTVFGVLCALILVRHRFPGKAILNAVIDLPVAISPVVVGLALFIVYGREGWIGPWLLAHGLRVIFALPGMVLATIFISLPFVVREVVPVLRQIGTEQEQAAQTLGASPLQIFWRVTLPAMRAGVTYGVVLTTARALGEFGAVSIVSGRLAGQTETLTLYVQERFEQFDLTGAYTASVVLALLALATVVAMNLFKGRRAL